MDTKQKGSIGETAVMLEALKRGYTVSLPYGDDARYDLIIDDGSLKRVQVKTTTIKDGGFNIKLCSHFFRSGREFKRKMYTEDEIDMLLAYETTTGKIYSVPKEYFGNTQLRLRVEPSKSHATNIKYAEDFIW